MWWQLSTISATTFSCQIFYQNPEPRPQNAPNLSFFDHGNCKEAPLFDRINEVLQDFLMTNIGIFAHELTYSFVFYYVCTLLIHPFHI